MRHGVLWGIGVALLVAVALGGGAWAQQCATGVIESAKVRFRYPNGGDTFAMRARIAPLTALDPLTEDFVLGVWNDIGVLHSEFLYAGSFVANKNSTRFSFRRSRPRDARRHIYKASLKQDLNYSTGDLNYIVVVKAVIDARHADPARNPSEELLELGNIRIQFALGGDIFFMVADWECFQYRHWRLDDEPLPDTCPTYCFQDRGDGTIWDTCTELQWEKKDGADGVPNPANLHDVDNYYTWAGLCSTMGACQPNAAAAATCAVQASGGTEGCSVCASGTCNVDPTGNGAITTVWDWVNQVNAANFAGHNDWRLPSEEGLKTGSPTPRELETILRAPFLCGPSLCIDPIFGPTAASLYWSATTSTGPFGIPGALGVSFLNGGVGFDIITYNHYVRAVRSGP